MFVRLCVEKEESKSYDVFYRHLHTIRRSQARGL